MTWRAPSMSSRRIGALPPVDGPRPTSRAMPSRHQLAHRPSPTVVRVSPLMSRHLGAADRAEVVQRAQDEGGVVRAGLLVGCLGRERQRWVRRSSPVAAPAVPQPAGSCPTGSCPRSVPPSSGRQRRPRPNFAQRLDKLYATLSSVWTNDRFVLRCPCARRRPPPAHLGPVCRAPIGFRLRCITTRSHTDRLAAPRQRHPPNRNMTRRRGSAERPA